MPTFGLFLPENYCFRMIRVYNKERLFVTGTDISQNTRNMELLRAENCLYTISALLMNKICFSSIKDVFKVAVSVDLLIFSFA